MRLRDCDWQNITIERKVQLCRIRRGRDEGNGTRIDATPFYDELAELHKLVEETYSRNTEDADFPIFWDGMRMRGSLIVRDIYNLRRALDLVPNLSSCGIHPTIIRHILSLTKGTIFIFGGFKTGKTTTASAIQVEYVRHHSLLGLTIEDPAEINFDGEHGGGRIIQISLRRSEVEKKMEELMRSTFDTLLVSEIRSGAMAQAVYRAGAAGRLITVTGHGGSIEEGFARVHALASASNTSGEIGAASSLALLADSFELALLMVEIDEGVYGATEYLVGNAETRALLRKGDFAGLANPIAQTMGFLKNQPQQPSRAGR